MIRTKSDSGEILNTNKKRSRELHPCHGSLNVIRKNRQDLLIASVHEGDEGQSRSPPSSYQTVKSK
jgi:hypothetical protein